MKSRSCLCAGLLLTVLLVQAFCSCAVTWGSDQSPSVDKPTYVRIAKYYDNRRCAVTASLDDFGANMSAWQDALSMLTQKRIFHTIGIITAYADWNYTQYWINQGYTEAASHSRTHVSPPYTGDGSLSSKVSYEWQINGSKQDIIGNLTLPSPWRIGNNQYVYAWIEPYGQADAAVRQWLGITHYLCDRTISPSAPAYGYAYWDPENGLFTHVGYTIEIGDPTWKGGVTSVASLNSRFDEAYSDGTVYHVMAHPPDINWSKGGYADLHTDYISNRTDVWYVPLGLLYLYHWLSIGNVTEVASNESGRLETFNLTINHDEHQSFGAAYPATYVFNIPQNWTAGYVYYRYKEHDPWRLLDQRNSTEFFNGVPASRFNFTEHKAYVSVAFSNASDNIYLRILASPLSIASWTPTHLSVERGRTAGAKWTISFTNSGHNLMHATTISIINSSHLQVTPATENLSDIANQQIGAATFSITAPPNMLTGTENVSFSVSYYDATGASYTQNLNAPIIVTKLGTTIHVSAYPSEIKKDHSTILTAKLLDDNSKPVAAQTLSFSLGVNPLGNAKTDSDGNAIMNCTASRNAGISLVAVSYGENESYLGSTGSVNLTIARLETNVTTTFSPTHEKTMTLTAAVKDEDGNPVTDANVEFQVYSLNGWTAFASTKTDAKGYASSIYNLTGSGLMQFRTMSHGGTNYIESASSTVSLLVISFDYLTILTIIAVASACVAVVYALRVFLQTKKKGNCGLR